MTNMEVFGPTDERDFRTTLICDHIHITIHGKYLGILSMWLSNIVDYRILGWIAYFIIEWTIDLSTSFEDDWGEWDCFETICKE